MARKKKPKSARTGPTRLDGTRHGGRTPKREFRMPEEEYDLIRAAAEQLGLSVSEFVRQTIIARAQRIVKGK